MTVRTYLPEFAPVGIIIPMAVITEARCFPVLLAVGMAGTADGTGMGTFKRVISVFMVECFPAETNYICVAPLVIRMTVIAASCIDPATSVKPLLPVDIRINFFMAIPA